MAKGAFKLTFPRVPELALHQQIADAFRREIAAPGRISAQGVVFWSIDIAAYSGSTPGLRTSRAVIAGIPDMILLHAGRAFFIEVKARDGKLSEEQRDVGASILASGCRYGIARDAKEALALLDTWEIPRRGAMRI